MVYLASTLPHMRYHWLCVNTWPAQLAQMTLTQLTGVATTRTTPMGHICQCIPFPPQPFMDALSRGTVHEGLRYAIERWRAKIESN